MTKYAPSLLRVPDLPSSLFKLEFRQKYATGLVAVSRTPLALSDGAVFAVATTVVNIRGVRDVENVHELLHGQGLVLTVAEAAFLHQD